MGTQYSANGSDRQVDHRYISQLPKIALSAEILHQITTAQDFYEAVSKEAAVRGLQDFGVEIPPELDRLLDQNESGSESMVCADEPEQAGLISSASVGSRRSLVGRGAALAAAGLSLLFLGRPKTTAAANACGNCGYCLSIGPCTYWPGIGGKRRVDGFYCQLGTGGGCFERCNPPYVFYISC